jgi:GGDEF domain-containing protein
VNYTANGLPYWVEMEIVPFLGRSRRAHPLGRGRRDISERRRPPTAIHRLAFYDVLTGLPNRRLLMEQLDALLARPGPARAAAPCFIDLDHFKNVNDARGHATGDALLRSAAQRLSRR